MMVGSVVWWWRLWRLILVLVVSGSLCHCTNGNTGSGNHVGGQLVMLVIVVMVAVVPKRSCDGVGDSGCGFGSF